MILSFWIIWIYGTKLAKKKHEFTIFFYFFFDCYHYLFILKFKSRWNQMEWYGSTKHQNKLCLHVCLCLSFWKFCSFYFLLHFFVVETFLSQNIIFKTAKKKKIINEIGLFSIRRGQCVSACTLQYHLTNQNKWEDFKFVIRLWQFMWMWIYTLFNSIPSNNRIIF